MRFVELFEGGVKDVGKERKEKGKTAKN